MYTQGLVDSLADRAYAAMLDSERWPGFLTHLTNALGGCSPTLYRHDPRNHAGSLDIAVDYDPTIARAYKEYLSQCNVWVRSGIQNLTVGRVRTSHMMCSRSVLLRSQWWTDFCRPMSITQGLGGTILRYQDVTYNITVFANDSRPPFAEEDQRLLAVLMPHLQRALRVSMHLGEIQVRQGCLAEALDRLPTAVFLIAGDGRVLYMNHAAERLVANGGGLAIDRDGISTARPSDTAAFRRLIGRAALTSAGSGNDAGGTMAVSRTDGRRPLDVLVSPIRLKDVNPFLDTAAALVYVSDPDAMSMSAAAALQRRFGLTSAETRVAMRIGEGKTIRQIAELLHVSPHTVRTQLKAVLAKTGTARQGELICLLTQTRATKD